MFNIIAFARQRILFCQASAIRLYDESQLSSTDRGRKNDVN